MFSVADLAATDLSTLDAMRATRLSESFPGRTLYDEMAMQLNAWMCDDEHAAKYREIYGYDWSPIPPVVEASDEPIAVGTDRFTRSLAETR
jgi:hypothetical protein